MSYKTKNTESFSTVESLSCKNLYVYVERDELILNFSFPFIQLPWNWEPTCRETRKASVTEARNLLAIFLVSPNKVSLKSCLLDRLFNQVARHSKAFRLRYRKKLLNRKEYYEICRSLPNEKPWWVTHEECERCGNVSLTRN